MEIFSYWRKTARYFSQHITNIYHWWNYKYIFKKENCLLTNFWSISISNSLNKNWKLQYKFYDIFCWWLDNIIGRKCLSFVQFSLYDFKPTAEYLIPQKRLNNVIYFSAFHVEIGMWTFDSSGNTGTHCPLKLIYVIAELRKSQQYLYI